MFFGVLVAGKRPRGDRPVDLRATALEGEWGAGVTKPRYDDNFTKVDNVFLFFFLIKPTCFRSLQS